MSWQGGQKRIVSRLQKAKELPRAITDNDINPFTIVIVYGNIRHDRRTYDRISATRIRHASLNGFSDSRRAWEEKRGLAAKP